MLCKRHLQERQAELESLRSVKPRPGQDLASQTHPAWAVSEAESALRLARSRDYCVDCHAEAQQREDERVDRLPKFSPALTREDCEMIDRAWGGLRPGAGRKPLTDEPTIEGTISLPFSLDAKAKRLGDGNRSAGIRKALESFIE